MDLIFAREGRKLYAATPAGELAFGDQQGLYEWARGRRVQYSGGDRQCSDHGVMWNMTGRGEPSLAGFGAAVHPARLN